MTRRIGRPVAALADLSQHGVEASALPPLDESGPTEFTLISKNVRRLVDSLEETVQDRTAALAHRIAFERLAAEIAARFINVPIDHIDATIEAALGRLARFLEVDNISVRVLDETGGALVLTHRWRSDENPRYDFGHKLLVKEIPWLYERLQSDEVVQVSDLAEIPPEAGNERTLFAYLDQTSSMTVPLHQSSGRVGMLYFTMRNEKRVWSSDDESLLRFLSGSIANALERKQAGLALEMTIRDRTHELSASLERMEKLNVVLTRANTVRDRFLSTMSHELRTPMNAVLGYADMLEGLYYGDLNEKQKTHVAAITTSGNQLLALLDNLVEVNRINSGAVELQSESITIEDLLEAPVAMVRARAEKRCVELTVEPTPDLPMLFCDPNRTNQILLNLLNNALKYTGEGGRVTLRACREDAYARIEVSDTGIGITPEHQATIFEEFEQADRERDEALGGIGMGLPLCKRLVQLHGGRMGLESTVDVGSTFWFTLPLAEDAPVATASAQPAADAERRSVAPATKLILVAEDNEMNLGMILDMLEALGFRTLGVPDGRTALETAQTSGPDLILMDVRMPVMDGLEATRRIRALPGCAEIPIIALTANAAPADQKECLAAGCLGFLSKPIQMATLDAELKRFFGSPASRHDPPASPDFGASSS
jgi:signal transduction histidine kinase/ActR/RegA family two-component response regulator